jgi:YHS domain-containing protein
MVVDTTKLVSKEVALVVDNKYDPVCKMPVTAGITDTTSHNGKTIGFCSPECKEEFLANPKDYQLVMKK